MEKERNAVVGKIKHRGFNQQIKVARTRLQSRWAFPSYWENAVTLWVIGLHNQRLCGDVSTQSSLYTVESHISAPASGKVHNPIAEQLSLLMEFSYDHAIQQDHQGQLAYKYSQPASLPMHATIEYFLQFTRVMKRRYVFRMYLESDFYGRIWRCKWDVWR